MCQRQYLTYWLYKNAERASLSVPLLTAVFKKNPAQHGTAHAVTCNPEFSAQKVRNSDRQVSKKFHRKRNSNRSNGHLYVRRSSYPPVSVFNRYSDLRLPTYCEYMDRQLVVFNFFLGVGVGGNKRIEAVGSMQTLYDTIPCFMAIKYIS